MALTLRERCTKRLAGLKSNRRPYEAEAREIASYAQPARSRFNSGDTNKNARQRNARLNSSHGIFAFRTLQGGMTSGLSSPSRPWFSLQTYDEALMHDHEVKLYLAEVEKRMYAFLASTNFYAAVKSGYLEMGLFGTEACLMDVHTEEGAVCHPLTFGEYWIATGDALTPDTLYRHCPLTTNQIMQHVQSGFFRNPHPRVQRAYDAGDYDASFPYFHAVEPNDDMRPGVMGPQGMAYRSVYWDEADDRKEDYACVRVSGYEEQPFWAPRWDTVGGDAWGIGPGHDGLSDLRELQLQAKRKAEAVDMVIWPEIISPAKVKLRRQPKSVVAASELDGAKVMVPHEVPYQAIGAINDDIARCEEAINRASFADLFMAITNMAGVQPRNVEEIASRNEEKLTQLGPVIERVNNEKLEVAIERTFGIMERANLLPPAPDIIAESGGEIKIDFVSILTQMQRMVGLGNIERTVGFVASQMGAFPEARHKLKIFEVIDDYASRAGGSQKFIRPNEEAEKLLLGEQESVRQAQMAEMAQKMAPAGKVAVDAAQLAAEAGAGGLPMGGAMPL